MKTLIKNLMIVTVFASCSSKLQVNKDKESVISIVNTTHQRNAGIKKGPFQSYDKLVYSVREKAAQLFRIETDTSQINRFIVIDLVSFEGGKPMFGEMLLNDTAKYFYQTSFLNKEVEESRPSIYSAKTIVEYLKAHRFKELEVLANEKSNTMSGSNFFYIGLYEKGMDSIYVKLLPAFMEP